MKQEIREIYDAVKTNVSVIVQHAIHIVYLEFVADNFCYSSTLFRFLGHAETGLIACPFVSRPNIPLISENFLSISWREMHLNITSHIATGIPYF